MEKELRLSHNRRILLLILGCCQERRKTLDELCTLVKMLCRQEKLLNREVFYVEISSGRDRYKYGKVADYKDKDGISLTQNFLL